MEKFKNYPILDYIEKGMYYILRGLANDYGLDLTDVNFKDTPKRVSKMYAEIFAGIKNTDKQVNSILDSSFPSTSEGMIIAKNIRAYSICPHHFLPVDYVVDIGYIPNGKVIGLSKLSRLVELLAKRPILQEILTEEIVNYLQKLDILGVMVIIRGQHYCMKMRGVKQQNSEIITSAVRGNFKDNEKTRKEFLDLIRR